MKRQIDASKVFCDDEMTLLSVEPAWSAEQLLDKEGIFFLKDVVKLLLIDPVKLKRRVREMEDSGKSPWEIMGIRKVWNRWVVRMLVFAPYYRSHLLPRVRRVEESWDGNTLLKQEGIFYLTAVCRLIPFTAFQLRYQAKRHANARQTCGVWKDEDLGSYVVDMERFGPWIARLWQGGFE